MKIVISALHFDWQNIDHCLRRVQDEFGLNGVELSWYGSFSQPHCMDEDMNVLRRIKGKTNLILGAHIWEDLAQLGPGAGEKVLLFWLKHCRDTGVTGLVIHGGTFPDQKEGIARTRQILEGVLGDFERAGVVLNLENHYAYDYHNSQELFSEPWEFLEVLSLDSPSLRFCFDTGHAHMTRNSEALLRQLAPWLHYVHLADNHGKDDDHFMFRQGTVNWDSVFDTLRDIGFDGTFCVEFPVRQDTEPFHACVAELRKRWS